MSLDQVWPPLLGGAAIGLASALLLIFSGRIAGISGIVNGLLRPEPGETAWRAAFVAGLALAGAGVALVLPAAFPDGGLTQVAGLPTLAVAGLLVGFGSKLGSGCTSGHGVCGIGRLAPRSLVATLTFMFTGAVTVFVARHLL